MAMASTVLPLGVTFFLKALLKNLSLAPGVVTGFRGSFRSFLVEFLAVPVCAYALLAMVCPAAIDLAIVARLS
jgi:hypothetical protein